MSRKLLLILPTLLLLSGCETAQPEAPRFVGVPLIKYAKADQARAFDKIVAACGRPPHCPESAILEQWALDYVKLRAEVGAVER